MEKAPRTRRSVSVSRSLCLLDGASKSRTSGPPGARKLSCDRVFLRLSSGKRLHLLETRLSVIGALRTGQNVSRPRSGDRQPCGDTFASQGQRHNTSRSRDSRRVFRVPLRLNSLKTLVVVPRSEAAWRAEVPNKAVAMEYTLLARRYHHRVPGAHTHPCTFKVV